MKSFDMDLQQENNKLEHLLEIYDRLMPLIAKIRKTDKKKSEDIISIINELTDLYHQEIANSYKMWKLIQRQDDQLFTYMMNKAFGFKEKEIKIIGDNLKFAFDHDKKIKLIKKYAEYVNG